MSVIIRNRTIRPSTRDVKSKYRIQVTNAMPEDEIVVFIDHESADFRAIYKCTGAFFQEKDSIYFKVEDVNNKPIIIWSGDNVPELVR
ncbi:hypothetical protein [Zobellia barbeyronii]|uniref:Uncharacterized protein n=1 Tax=Zobellia barbeyronii TaxID=2748009 RepID=A0ABS5WD45_9FLAO|nr:hypothetical protein [Zobellia barbeyronii]MBT2161318.1 hypothetical protein [Zobellia barbeyronii]